MQKSIKVGGEEYDLLQTVKKETGIKSSPIVIKLALTNFIQSKDYAKLKLGLVKGVK